MAVQEAALRTTKYGLVYEGDGWFVLNARESRWRDYGRLGAACNFEGKRPFKQLGAGDGPSVVLAVGARGGRKGLVYEVDAAAQARGAGVDRETRTPAEAYARFPRPSRTAYRDGWLPDF